MSIICLDLLSRDLHWGHEKSVYHLAQVWGCDTGMDGWAQTVFHPPIASIFLNQYIYLGNRFCFINKLIESKIISVCPAPPSSFTFFYSQHLAVIWTCVKINEPISVQSSVTVQGSHIDFGWCMYPPLQHYGNSFRCPKNAGFDLFLSLLSLRSLSINDSFSVSVIQPFPEDCSCWWYIRLLGK